MKPTKLIGSKHAETVCESRCANKVYNRSGTACKLIGKNEKRSKLKDTQSKNVLKHAQADGVNDCLNTNEKFGFSKRDTVNRQKTKLKNYVNTNANQYKTNIGKNIIKPILSGTYFIRKFSKYDDFQRKSKVKFGSAYQNSGKFGQNSAKYKAFINKNLNEKNKQHLKYTTCNSAGFNEEIKKKKRAILCSNLPGNGTYNHRFAYDDALQLHRRDINVDVLYKVKNKTDSMYVINGEFLKIQNKRPENPFKRHKTELKVHKTNSRTRLASEHEELAVTRMFVEKGSSKLNNLINIQKAEARNKMKAAAKEREETEKEKQRKYKVFTRKKNMREIEKKIRADNLEKLVYQNELKNQNLKDEIKKKKLVKTMKVINDVQKNNIKIERLNEEQQKQRRLKFRENLALKFQKNKNVANHEPITNLINTCNEHEIITDANVINDIKRWALQNDGTVCPMSWLKMVSCRIGSLNGRVDEYYKNKWIQMAIDEVVDKRLSDLSKQALSHRKSSHNQNVKVYSSFAINTRRTSRRCRQTRATLIGVHKSPKFTASPAACGGLLCRVIKPKGCSNNFRAIGGAADERHGPAATICDRTECCRPRDCVG